MIYLVFTVVTAVSIFLMALQMMMLGRMIMQWFMHDADGPLVAFVFSTTEIIVGPIRAWFDKMKWFEGAMIDMSFITAVIILMMINLVLPTVRM